MMQESIRNHTLNIWYAMTLRKKLCMIIGIMGVILGASVFLNLKIVYYFIDHVYAIMDDNLSCYRFQEALEEETRLFALAMGDHSQETRSAYDGACQNTRMYLELLPYNQEIGENRYAITWNILNSYGVYEKQRDLVFGMQSEDQGYVNQLYEVYSMQKYLSRYASRLTRAVLLEGNDYYAAKLPELRKLPLILWITGVTIFSVLLFSMGFVTKGLLHTVGELAEASRRIERNDFSSPDIYWRGKDEIGQMVKAFNKMKRSMEDYIHTYEEKRRIEKQLHSQEMEKAQLEQRFSMAQLQLIKSQLNPHFLFNTLNMITRMAQMEEAPVTEEMLVAMSNLLRYSLRTTEPLVPLEEELKVVRDYMYIQQMRFGSRISFRIDCEKELYGREVPVFLLQPLVENAVIHGLIDREEGGSIKVRIEKKEELIWIFVEDTGVGMNEERLSQIRKGIENRGSGLGIGLGNIYRRITAYYEGGKVLIDSREGQGTRVFIEFGAKRV